MVDTKNTEKETIQEFKQAMNMSATELTRWLETEDSKEVGQKQSDRDESTGHASGRRIVELLGKKQSEYSEDDIAHMRKVVSYVHRHSAQRPSGEIEDTRWRHSLMNWGHDPLKN
ncbi:DUF3140 domain-containing protein [Phormidium tenue FACHB-886]|nr:DUF3140 domain-containing protein [Phormidium tenue FACHB-886]